MSDDILRRPPLTEEEAQELADLEEATRGAEAEYARRLLEESATEDEASAGDETADDKGDTSDE